MSSKSGVEQAAVAAVMTETCMEMDGKSADVRARTSSPIRVSQLLYFYSVLRGKLRDGGCAEVIPLENSTRVFFLNPGKVNQGPAVETGLWRTSY